MTAQHADLFHCLACGRVAYEPHGGSPPDCCGQPMVLAVADVVNEMPAGSGHAEQRGDVEEHALFAEVVELSQWCHGLQDVDISRGEELANRLSVLYQAMIDQFDEGEAATSSRTAEPSESLRDDGRKLLFKFSRFVAQLRNGPSPFENWAQICDRLDELVSDFRQFVQSERFHRAEAPAKGSRG